VWEAGRLRRARADGPYSVRFVFADALAPVVLPDESRSTGSWRRPSCGGRAGRETSGSTPATASRPGRTSTERSSCGRTTRRHWQIYQRDVEGGAAAAVARPGRQTRRPSARGIAGRRAQRRQGRRWRNRTTGVTTVLAGRRPGLGRRGRRMGGLRERRSQLGRLPAGDGDRDGQRLTTKRDQRHRGSAAPGGVGGRAQRQPESTPGTSRRT